jgi:outer membrane protein OmpA-like peptidoglycan-associated protein
VRNYLINRGIEPSRFTASGFGSDKPVGSNESPEGRSKNRRAVIRILPSRQG